MGRKPTYKELEQTVKDLEEDHESTRRDAALRESESRYRRLFETAQDGILILDAGTPAQEILDEGAQGFIQKPFSLVALSEKIQEVMEEYG